MKSINYSSLDELSLQKWLLKSAVENQYVCMYIKEPDYWTDLLIKRLQQQKILTALLRTAP